MRKILPQPGFDPRTVQPVASRYTEWAVPAQNTSVFCVIYLHLLHTIIVTGLRNFEIHSIESPSCTLEGLQL